MEPRRFLRNGCVLIFAALAPSLASAQMPERATMTAVRMSDEERITLDGALDEPIWRRAVPATNFIQQFPQTGAPATEQTEVRIIYNRTTLYMGVTCFDSEPDRWLGYQIRRDQFLQADDRFMWIIDPFLTGQGGYHFETNPSGLMGEGLIGPAGYNREWDGIWDLRVRRSAIGWTLEIAIPFSTLNFDPDGTTWGINFQRTVRRKAEESLWTGWALNQGLFRFSNTGLVTGLNQNVTQGIGLDVRPYALGLLEASPVTGRTKTEGSAKAGLDLFYSVTPGLRANFTVNTDFAQTEVDQRAVNLTQFALFYPEKRTFFLEGANYFDFGTSTSVGIGDAFRRETDNSLIPFFSRRIGLDEHANPETINYGVRMIGQIGQRLDVGVLQVQTGDEPDRQAVGENFTAVRVKQRLFRQSYVGVLYTGRDGRDAASPLRAPQRAGVRAGDPALRTIGADFQLATSTFRGSKNLSAGGFFLNTTNPLHTGRNAAYGLWIDYPNDRWNTGVAYRVVEDNFRPAVGFMTRTSGYKRYLPYFNFSPRPRNSRLFRRFGFTADVDLQLDTNNDWLTRLWSLTLLDVDFQSEDNFSILVLPEYERLHADFRVNARDNVALPRGREYDFVRYRVTGQTANRRVIAIAPTLEWGGFHSGTRRQFSLNLTARLRPGLIIYTSAELNEVDLPETHFTAQLFRLTPDLAFGQWVSLVNVIQYDSVSRVVGWQSRFRWILRPGDDVYFVYTHNWLDDPVRDRLLTLNRQAATKVLYTRRF
ncbi:MAG: carbohydrate binding family 9 domain-containing protein [Acidobacteria bacterium]|nr:carbohydrate binding family 9 domain-containing protein [Acidobacteriota bacterium]